MAVERDDYATADVALDPGFWRKKPLEALSSTEWEALCDGCGRCCLLKLEDDDTEALYFTRVACRLLDIGACCCTAYADRHTLVPDCVALTPDLVEQLAWLPETCAYRLVANGADLAWWHPLISGDPQTVHDAGISVRSFAISENKVDEDDVERFIISF